MAKYLKIKIYVIQAALKKLKAKTVSDSSKNVFVADKAVCVHIHICTCWDGLGLCLQLH